MRKPESSDLSECSERHGKTGKRENEKTSSSLIPILLLLILSPALVSGNGGGLDEATDLPKPSGGEFYAEVESRDDLLAVNGFIARVLVHPNAADWPETTITPKAFDASIRVMIKVRAISVPSNLQPRDRPIAETRRESERFDDAMRFVWNLIEATDGVILQNPSPVEGTQHVGCDVFFELSGMKLSFAETLVKAGHARYEPHDWGKRMVERK